MASKTKGRKSEAKKGAAKNYITRSQVWRKWKHPPPDLFQVLTSVAGREEIASQFARLQTIMHL